MNQQLNTPKEVRTMNPERPNGETPSHAEGGTDADRETGTGPHIYVASLADYNAGRLHGTWIDATQDTEAIHAAIAEMLARSPEPIAEEWAIHDYNGFFGLSLSEHESIDRLSRVARGIEAHGAAFASWLSACAPDEDTIDGFEDAYHGTFDSREEYVEELVDDLGYQKLNDAFPGQLGAYVRFDGDALVHDAELSGDITIVDNPDGTISVFHA